MASLAKSVSSLGERLQNVTPKWSELLKQETPYYNIFEILNIRHYEEKVHTPILRHLLDPEANHEHGFLFIESFFNQVLKCPLDLSSLKRYKIYEELLTSQGRIDLLITYNFQNQDKAVVIENKIYASDQRNQLERYFRYIRSQRGIGLQHFKLVYLSPYGHPPSQESIRTSLSKILIKGDNLKIISYYKHILLT